ncbi:MAG TPA: tetratricopeptide repeat protein [Thermoanaerobaculia bacterium]|nr:tetratricopeptide repeat protein [Thermoanaerobaculia bacterium]
MRAFVFTDKALERYAGRFVWLSVDTENSKNADFLKKYPINVWPTLLVIDPSKERIALRYAGGATVGQLSKLLDQALSKTKSPSDDALARADVLAGEGKNEEAAKEYDLAIVNAPKGWRPFGRAAEGLIMALTMKQQNERCATRADELYPRLRGTLSGANVAAYGLGCASSLPAENAKRGALLESLEKATRASLDDPKIDMSGDDRSGLYESIVDALKAQKNEEGAKKAAEQWAAFLEGQAAKAKTAEQRAVYDSHRMTAYMELGTLEKAVPMLEQSERDLPRDYNPPARLGTLYRMMKKYDQSLAAYDRALKLAYGPRKIGILRGRADTLAAKGDKEAARQTLRDAIAYAKSLPAGQVSERTISALEKKLETM